MKKIIYYCVVCIAALLTACGDDNEELVNMIDFSSPYVLADNPNDPIQHRCYQIYQEYKVPVFFNDTIQKTLVGQSVSGEDIYRYETLDLNWSFSESTKGNITYTFTYFQDDEQKNKALDFVEHYLSSIFPTMRPFSILLVEDMTVYNENTQVTEYYAEKGYKSDNYRTLVIVDPNELDEAGMNERSENILKEMVTAKIKNDEALVTRFTNVSRTATDDYYDKDWIYLGCQPTDYFKNSTFQASKLWNETFINKLMSMKYDINGVISFWALNTFIPESDYYEVIRPTIISQIGQFGFICGNIPDGIEGVMSPENPTTDLDFYIETMLVLGSKLFTERYGTSPLVMLKFNLLNNFMKDELGVDLSTGYEE